jgi:short-subunit dehydrogenase
MTTRAAVTGGARGIGAAIAEALRADGAEVVTGDLAGADLTLDVTDGASVRAFLDAAGPLDVLVNNAGVMWVGSYADEPEAWTRRMFDVNTIGVINGVRAALPEMVRRGSGHIITVASAASRVAPPGEATYAATKHAVLGYLEGVRAELRRDRVTGVHLSIVMPGVVETELAAGTHTARGMRLLQPQDVAKAVVAVVHKPRFEVPVPARIGPLTQLSAALPRSLRDRLTDALVPNQVTSDKQVRKDYESRD